MMKPSPMMIMNSDRNCPMVNVVPSSVMSSVSCWRKFSMVMRKMA